MDLRQRRLQMPLGARVLMDLTGILLLPAVLVIVSAATMHSWPMSYNLLVGNTEPNDAEVTNKALGYLLSLTGWLVIPSIIGAVAGEVASDILERYKGRPLLDLVEEARRELATTEGGGPPPVYVDPEGLDDVESGHGAPSVDDRRTTVSWKLYGCIAFLLAAARILVAWRRRGAVQRPLRGKRAH